MSAERLIYLPPLGGAGGEIGMNAYVYGWGGHRARNG